LLFLFTGLCLTATFAYTGLFSKQTSTKQIQNVTTGVWVKAENPTGEQDLQFGTDVDPETWKLLKLKAPKTDGSYAKVTLLRPDAWLKSNQAEVGSAVHISVPECGIDGDAYIQRIAACPQIAARPGPDYQLVTGTFQHFGVKVLDVGLSNGETIGSTPNHPWWSEDRQAFVRADELKPGEHLSSLTVDKLTVTHLTPRPGTHTVYNLEIQVDHVYHIGKSGALVHNGADDCFVTLYHGTSSNRASKILGGKFSDLEGFRNVTTYLAEDSRTAHHFALELMGNTKIGNQAPKSLTVL